MIYTTKISLLIEKAFYLLRPQRFSFQIGVRVYRYICEFFLTLCPKGGAFDSLFCPKGRVFVHNDCPGGRIFAPFKSCLGGLFRGGMVLDEVDTCIMLQKERCRTCNNSPFAHCLSQFMQRVSEIIFSPL